MFGGMRFYDRKEIKDVLAYLRLIAFPKDDLSLGRIINVPRRGIGDATLETLASWQQRTRSHNWISVPGRRNFRNCPGPLAACCCLLH
ncbi:MAG: hypothetical protein LRY35_03610 [Clostridiales bacterium]|nr:hypothetical protein [Clostridiales bacterium]